MSTIKVKIVGPYGYGGVGAVELLSRHPNVELAALVDVNNPNIPYSKMYPHLAGFVDQVVVEPTSAKAQERADVVFFSTPDGVGMKQAPAELAKGSKVIDYSGDFRFNSEAGYQDYAQRLGRDTAHSSTHLLPQAVYGLSELHREQLNTQTQLVGNPGCFAVSCILGLAPAVKHSAVTLNSIICDCKTGVSGAGKTPSPTFHYPARYDHMNAYKLAGHQHVCEVERELTAVAGATVQITFTAHVVPVCRGIMSTLYATLTKPMTEQDVIQLYREFYKESRFVRVFESTTALGSAHVRGSNFCNLVISVDARTQRLRIVSYIDNLLKGQSGSAVQNMNLIFGLPETTGLDAPGDYP